MSQTVLGSCDSLSSGVCTDRLAGSALIIRSAVWNLGHSTLTEAVFICFWAEDCPAPLLSFKVIFSFVFPNCMLFISYRSPCGAPLWCSQQWHPGHDSQGDSLSLLTTYPVAAECQVTLPAANYCSPSHAPQTKPIIIQRKIKVLSDLGFQAWHRLWWRMPSSGWAAEWANNLGIHSSFYQLNSSQEP